MEDEHLPQKVIEWAEIVKQRLRDEEGVAKIVNLDGDEETRGIWGWVVQAWGVSAVSLVLIFSRQREDSPAAKRVLRWTVSLSAVLQTEETHLRPRPAIPPPSLDAS